MSRRKWLTAGVLSLLSCAGALTVLCASPTTAAQPPKRVVFRTQNGAVFRGIGDRRWLADYPNGFQFRLFEVNRTFEFVELDGRPAEVPLRIHDNGVYFLSADGGMWLQRPGFGGRWVQ